MLPKDPVMLLSYVNTQLRDFYSDLDDMCKSMNVDKEDIIERLKVIDYLYDESLNKFL